jgi:UDP-4-amino-4,6-dideoxy-N-acetyl-beta-L-altrosamine transaminase
VIPYGRQDINESDIEAVVTVLKSPFLTQGPEVPKFESTFAEFVGAGYGTATNSATSALHLVCLSLGIGPGDTVWVPAISFVATANCILYCGATVDFVDVESETALISVESLRIKLAEAKGKNSLPKAVIIVSFAGASPDMELIYQLAKEYDVKIIEDASHAVGASYPNGSKVGSCDFSEATVFSFHPVKIMTTGEGGMVVTNDVEVHKKIYRLRSHGITRSPIEMSSNLGPWYYEQIDLGFNYRMTDIQAALGSSQLLRVPEFIKRRRVLADLYFQKLAGTGLGLPDYNQLNLSSWHLFVVRIGEDAGISREQVIERLSIAGYGTNVHYIPIYRHPYYRRQVVDKDFRLEGAESYFSRALTLPLHTKLENRDLEKICRTIFESQGFQSIF